MVLDSRHRGHYIFLITHLTLHVELRARTQQMNGSNIKAFPPWLGYMPRLLEWHSIADCYFFF